MNQGQLVQNTVHFVKKTLVEAEGGHDWFHIERVYNTANLILKNEKADELVVKLSALLHDIADPKFHDGDESIGPKIAQEFLRGQNTSEGTIDHVETALSGCFLWFRILCKALFLAAFSGFFFR